VIKKRFRADNKSEAASEMGLLRMRGTFLKSSFPDWTNQ
jgi:hypothetical protein